VIHLFNVNQEAKEIAQRESAFVPPLSSKEALPMYTGTIAGQG